MRSRHKQWHDATLAEAKKTVAAKLVPMYEDNFLETFPQALLPNIERAYHVVSVQTE